MNYDLDDDDDDEDRFLFALKTESNLNNNKNNKSNGNNANNGKFAQDVEGGETLSPYAKDGLVEQRIRDSEGVALRGEHLGEDFLDTPWRLPDPAQAEELRATEVYRGGAAVRSLPLTEDSLSLPVSVRLYFHLVKSLGAALCVTACFALPLLVFAWHGSSVSAEDRDAVGLYQFTLGNVGEAAPHVCSSNRMFLSPSANETCVTVQGIEFSSSEVSFVVTLFEFCQCLAFLFTIWHLRRRLYAYTQQAKVREHVSITHYAVYVTNLPPHVSEREIVEHFSSLYQLQKKDWRGRPPVEDARPVQRCDNTGRDVHKDSWVAECTIYRRIGRFLTHHKERNEALRLLYRSRAQMKMYAKDTSHGRGPDEKRYARAEREMLTHALKVDTLTQRMLTDAMRDARRAREERERALRRERGRESASQSETAAQQKEREKESVLRAISASVVSQRMASGISVSLSASDDAKETETPLNDASQQTPKQQSMFSLPALWKSLFPRNREPAALSEVREEGTHTDTHADKVKEIDVEQGAVVVRDNDIDKLRETLHSAQSHRSTDSLFFGEKEKEQRKKKNVEEIKRRSSRLREEGGNKMDDNKEDKIEGRPTDEIEETKDEGAIKESTKDTAVGDTVVCESVAEAAAPIGCFVIFEYNESFARCLDDYTQHSSLPYSLLYLVAPCLYPQPLRLRGHRLHVKRALDPEQTHFENLEISETRRRFYRLRTILCTALLVLLSFLLLLAASLARSLYASDIPSDEVCKKSLPALYAGVERYADEQYVGSMKLMRAPLFPLTHTQQNDTQTNMNIYTPTDIDMNYLDISDHTHIHTYTHRWLSTLNASEANDTLTDTNEFTYTRAELDAQCAALYPQAFFATYALHGDVSFPATNCSFSACANATQSPNATYCPLYTQSAFCPCVTLSPSLTPHDTRCASLSCQRSLSLNTLPLSAQRNALTQECRSESGHYDARALAQCYCKSRAHTLLTSSRLFDYVSALFRSGLEPPDPKDLGGEDAAQCGTFHAQYLASYVYTYAAIFVTVVINRILRKTLVYLTHHERHVSQHDEERSVLYTLFWATYVNMAVIVLVAFAVKLDLSTPSTISSLFSIIPLPVDLRLPFSLTLGVYTDFTRAWFGNIGVYLVCTFVLTAFVPPIESWLRARVVRPLWREHQLKYVNAKTSRSIVMQSDLNVLYVDETFSYTQHAAQLMAMLFFAMTFAPGLPLLSLLSPLLFKAVFTNDKMSLLRTARKPSMGNTEEELRTMREIICVYLPVFVCVRCVIAVAMFSSSDGLLSPSFPLWGSSDAGSSVSVSAAGQSASPGAATSSLSLAAYESFMQREIQSAPALLPEMLSPLGAALEARVRQSNVFPLACLCAFVLSVLVVEHLAWRSLKQVCTQTLSLLRYVFVQRCKSAAQVKQEAYLLQKQGDNQVYMHPYELLSLGDPLRVQSAPYTGIYFQFIGSKRERAMREAKARSLSALLGVREGERGCCSIFLALLCCRCCPCCRRKNNKSGEHNPGNGALALQSLPKRKPTSYDLERGTAGRNKRKIKNNDGEDDDYDEDDDEFLDDTLPHKRNKHSGSSARLADWEYLEGWEGTEMGLDYEIKVKTWMETAVGSDGVLHTQGQYKRTFEVISDLRCHTYMLQFVPSYQLAFLALRDLSFSLSSHTDSSPISSSSLSLSLVDDYLRRKSVRAGVTQFDPDKVEKEVALQIEDAIVHKKDEVFRDKIKKKKEKEKEKKNKGKKNKNTSKVVPIDAQTDRELDSEEKEEDNNQEKEGKDKNKKKKKGFLGSLFSRKSSSQADTEMERNDALDTSSPEQRKTHNDEGESATDEEKGRDTRRTLDSSDDGESESDSDSEDEDDSESDESDSDDSDESSEEDDDDEDESSGEDESEEEETSEEEDDSDEEEDDRDEETGK